MLQGVQRLELRSWYVEEQPCFQNDPPLLHYHPTVWYSTLPSHTVLIQ